jgi:ABC-2 type transport system permease protein
VGPLRPYLQFARLAFQRRAAYRLANWTGVVVNVFFLLIHAQVLLAFFRARPGALGWSPQDAVLYFTTSEALLMVVGIFPDYRYNLSERIRTGEVVTDLARPIALFWRDVAERYGTALYYGMARFPPVYLAGMLLFGVTPPLRLEMLLFPLSLVLAIGVSAGLWYIVCSSAYFRDIANGELTALMFANTLLGGMVVPLDFYPDWLQAIANALPFRATLYTPVALFSGMLTGGPLAFGLLHQLAWAGVLTAVALEIESRGLRRLATQGG